MATRTNKPPQSKAPASKSSIKVHDTLKLDKKNPIPVTFGGSAFTSIGSYEYLPFFAPTDNLFRTLLEARLLSPTHNNCILDKKYYSVGAGLQVKDQEFPAAFDKRLNKKRQTIDDILQAVFESHYADGNKFVEIVRTEVMGERYVHVYPHNNMDCRFELRKDGADPTHVLRSKEFRRDNIYSWKKDEKPIRIPLWEEDNPDTWLKDGAVERTVIHIKNEIQGVDDYGLPSSFPGLTNTVLEWKSTSFNLDNFDNNMFLAALLLIEGGMSPDEEKKFLRNLQKMYTGEGRAQRILPVNVENGTANSKLIPFTERNEGHFMEFDSHNTDKIISSHGWSRVLMDLKEGASLGKGGEFIKQLFLIKFQTQILPPQQLVLNNFIFPLMMIIDEWKGTKFYDLPWYIKPVIPVSMEGLLDINSLLTVDEGREEIGRAPIGGEIGKKQISEVAAKQKDEDPKKKEGKK